MVMKSSQRLEQKLEQQLEFFFTADNLKKIERKNLLHDGSRWENVAEHSWHASLLAMLLAEYAPEDVSMARVVQLLTLHDLIEIYAGDTYALGDALSGETRAREFAAGRKLFGILPNEQAEAFWQLWREFEDLSTPDARFARAIDVLHSPLVQWGRSEANHPINEGASKRLVLERKRQYLQDYPALWQLLHDVLDRAVAKGFISED